MRRPTAVLAALLCALALPATACAKPTIPKGPSGLSFYTPPSPLPGKRHGDVIRARTETRRTLASAAKTYLVLYRSTSVSGKPVAVSGDVAVPKGAAPKGGWPVVAWDHGTTGIADVCAPSRFGAGGTSYVKDFLNGFLKAGYAVVATDYEGLGTPGAHPYLIGKSEGRSTLDIVRAARELNPLIGRRVAIAGHSQGGHAALWAASLARSWTPELRVRATVAFAPASHVADQGRLLGALNKPSAVAALAALILRGVDVANPGLHLSGLLSDSAAALYPQTLAKCVPALAGPDSFGGQSPASLIRAGADTTPVIVALAASDPEHLHIATPVRVEQGTGDTTVFPRFTNELVQAYQTAGVPVTYRTYNGVSHGAIVTAAAADATAYVRQRLR
ncbi:MAG: alpha/beta hydrolase [Solirubrobacteraceae bacterium]